MIYGLDDGQIILNDYDIKNSLENFKDYVMKRYGEIAIRIVGQCNVIHNLDPKGCTYEQFATKPFEGSEDDNYNLMQDYWNVVIEKICTGLLAQMISERVTINISDLM